MPARQAWRLLARGVLALAGLLDKTGGELAHLISDAATMQIIRWTDGGFGMAAHNYDGDMLTDEVSQAHRALSTLALALAPDPGPKPNPTPGSQAWPQAEPWRGAGAPQH